MKTFFAVFAALCAFLLLCVSGCIGIFGLAAFTVQGVQQERNKEVAQYDGEYEDAQSLLLYFERNEARAMSFYGDEIQGIKGYVAKIDEDSLWLCPRSDLTKKLKDYVVVQIADPEQITRINKGASVYVAARIRSYFLGTVYTDNGYVHKVMSEREANATKEAQKSLTNKEVASTETDDENELSELTDSNAEDQEDSISEEERLAEYLRQNPKPVLEIAAWRVWRDATGGFSVEAVLVAQTRTAVKLRKRDNTDITLPQEKLSKADRDYLLGQRDSKRAFTKMLNEWESKAIAAGVIRDNQADEHSTDESHPFEHLRK